MKLITLLSLAFCINAECQVTLQGTAKPRTPIQFLTHDAAKVFLGQPRQIFKIVFTPQFTTTRLDKVYLIDELYYTSNSECGYCKVASPGIFLDPFAIESGQSDKFQFRRLIQAYGSITVSCEPKTVSGGGQQAK
jgi:hypothetical protein